MSSSLPSWSVSRQSATCGKLTVPNNRGQTAVERMDLLPMLCEHDRERMDGSRNNQCNSIYPGVQCQGRRYSYGCSAINNNRRGVRFRCSQVNTGKPHDSPVRMVRIIRLPFCFKCGPNSFHFRFGRSVLHTRIESTGNTRVS